MTGIGSAHRDDGEHDDRACSERVMSGRALGERIAFPFATGWSEATDEALTKAAAAIERELRRRKDTT